MMRTSEWDLSSIPDLAEWLFNGLYAVYNGKEYSDRKYALLPVELNDIDYPYLQIVRQVRTFDRKSLPRLSAANDEAISRWRTTFGIQPLLDMVGLTQELGSRAFSRHLSDLTLPATLNRISDTDRNALFAALVEALIPQSEFNFAGPLYPAFLKLAMGQARLPAPVLTRALTALIDKTPADWKDVLEACRSYFESYAKPSESPLGAIFFAVEEKLSRDYFRDLFSHGGGANFRPEDVWLIPWLFASTDSQRPSHTPLRVIDNSPAEYWIGFASPSKGTLPLKKDDMGHRVVQALEEELRRQFEATGGASLARKRQETFTKAKAAPSGGQPVEAESLAALRRRKLAG